MMEEDGTGIVFEISTGETVLVGCRTVSCDCGYTLTFVCSGICEYGTDGWNVEGEGWC
jgi:hypothetical protein